MRFLHPLAAALLALAAPLAAARAQAETWLDVATTSVRYGDTLSAAATTIAPTLRLRREMLSLQATGLLARFDAGTLSSQGAVEAALLLPALGPVRLELRGDAGGSAHEDLTRTGQYLGGARVHVGGASRGAWVGGGAGQVWDGARWYPLSVGELAGWSRLGAATVLASVTPVAMDTLRFADLQATVGWSGARLDLGASLGARTGAARIAGDRTAWGSVTAALRLIGPLSIVAGAGTYPVDYTQGYPGGQFGMLGLRLSSARPAEREAASDVRRRAPAGPAMSVGDERGGRRLVRVHAPAAARVEIAGDFTDWEPVALERGERGWWSARVAIRPGTHQLNVRVDGGGWLVPEGLTPIADEFGGVVGVLVVR